MVIGIAGGFIMSGLLAGAMSGSILLTIGFVTIGLLIAGIGSAAAKRKEKLADSCKLSQYPPYGY